VVKISVVIVQDVCCFVGECGKDGDCCCVFDRTLAESSPRRELSVRGLRRSEWLNAACASDVMKDQCNGGVLLKKNWRTSVRNSSTFFVCNFREYYILLVLRITIMVELWAWFETISTTSSN
jgi:hypothetical protein